jgi:hypothetical protein
MNLTKFLVLVSASVLMRGQDAASYLRQADSQAKAGQYRQAAASYQKAISLDPRNSSALEKLGDVYNHLSMPSEAAGAYEKAAELMLAAPGPVQNSPTVRQVSPTPSAPMAANRPTPPAVPKGGGGLEGLYFMTRVWGGGDLETATYWFHNGAVARNPVASTKSLDTQAERATHPNDVGTYLLQGGQLAVTLPTSNQQVRFEPMDHGCFGWDAGIFCPVEIFKTGATIDGTFTGGNSVGNVASNITITFKRDGSYDSSQVGSFSSKGTRTDVSGGSTRAEHGRYRIDGTALHMTPDGGKEEIFSTFPNDDHTPGPAPRTVYFSGIMLKRAK